MLTSIVRSGDGPPSQITFGHSVDEHTRSHNLISFDYHGYERANGVASLYFPTLPTYLNDLQGHATSYTPLTLFLIPPFERQARVKAYLYPFCILRML